MADTPAPGETGTPQAPENNSGSPAPTAGITNEEAAQLRKELEQARMRANQLENEKSARDKAAEEANRKRLEEKEEYKKLYEKSDAELKAIREREEAEARNSELATLSQDVFKDYSKEVQEIAQTAGISLTDESEVARATLKSKLDEIAKRVTPGQVAQGNNPNNLPPADPTVDTSPEFAPVGNEFSGKGGRQVTEMAMAGARNDLSVAQKYIGRLKTIEQMRKDSGFVRREI